MNKFTTLFRYACGICSAVLLAAVLVTAQQGRGTIRGLVTDELGAAVVGASVTLTDESGNQKNAVTSGEGIYLFNGLVPGKYLISAVAEGFSVSDDFQVDLAAGQRSTADLTLRIVIEEKVTVAAETPLSTEPTNNANQTVITGKDLDALPDDPDELAAALQALAGPSVGPNGGQILIDGFSGGRLPPKEAIREIRINQNPFAAENDQPSGRIDILTRPGTEKLRGSSFFSFEDESLNSRNPFSNNRTPYRVRQFGGNLSGPVIKKKASFFLDFQRRETDDNELVTATILDETLTPQFLGFGVVAPRRNTTFSPRFDYQLNTNNTLVARYSYSRNRSENAGIGGFSLPERAYKTASSQQTFQLTETAVLNASMINETRFQYSSNHNESLGENTIPVLDVSGAFTGGGSQVGLVSNLNRSWELQDFLSWQAGAHAFKFGGRMRGVRITDINPNNFGGTYRFTGAFVPQLDANNQPILSQPPVFVDSLERYRRTLLGQQLGLTPLEIRALGGGAAQFSISAGNPTATVSQFDVGIYAQDDWRVRPNLTLSYGLRYENQSNLHSPLNLAPRVALAWSPGAADSTRPPSMVIRAGAGVFYNRFSETNTLQAHRFNAAGTQQYFITERPLYLDGLFVPPVASSLDLFPSLPDPSSLSSTPQIVWRVADDLQAPTVYLGGIQIEKQLPYKFTMFAGYYTVHIQHVVRARDINAPLPGSITADNPNGVRPFGVVGEIYQYESSGRFDQNQLFFGVNNRLNRTISFSANYFLSKSQNDSDGLFPVNSYELTGEYGRAGFDVRHRFNFFGTLNLPWQVTLNPLVTVTSGRPFNITTGQDTNLDRLFTERPSFAPAGVDCRNPPTNIICTSFGNFNLRPGPGEQLIPRNFGQGPGFFVVNLRTTKTWNFGSLPSSRAANSGRAPQDQTAARGRGGRGAVPRIPGGGPGGGFGGGGGFRGIGAPGASGAENKRFSLQFSVNFSNIFNKVNLTTPVGNLSSTSFGESLGLASPFGGFGGGGGFGTGGSGAGNRRVSAQLRFNF